MDSRQSYRVSSRLSMASRMDDDDSRRYSVASSSIAPPRNSVTFSTRRVVSPTGTAYGSENGFQTPPSSPTRDRGNIFATPINSIPSSSNNSQVDLNVFADPTPAIRPVSLSLSVPREPSPIPVADGGWPGFGRHRRSLSLSRSVTPSSSGSSGLHRSNTTNTYTTTDSSYLYSIPSQVSSPPSPLNSIAPVRPRFDYGGHQQTLSIHGSELDEVDPFGDNFEVPVGDGFAPHTASTLVPRVSSDNGSLPPPYSQYPDLTPKPEDHNLSPIPTDSDSGGELAEGEDGVRRRQSRRRESTGSERRRGAVAVVPVSGIEAHAVENDLDDPSGALKEWGHRPIYAGRPCILILAGVATLLVGLAIGLGVGLGIGLHKAEKAEDSSRSSSTTMTTATNYAPTPEQTSAPKSDPSNAYPDIPTGFNIISPLALKSIKDSCKIMSEGTFPDYFSLGSIGLWSCNIPTQKPLSWEFEEWPTDLVGAGLSKLDSLPHPLVCADWDGKWGGYIVSSLEGKDREQKKNTVYIDPQGNRIEYSVGGGFREGMQGPAFYREPFSFNNVSEFGSHQMLTRSTNSSDLQHDMMSYKFGILYNKTVVLRESTLDETFKLNGANSNTKKGNGSELSEGDRVWMCIWEKTLLDIEVMVHEESVAGAKKVVDSDGGSTGHSSGDTNGPPQITTIVVDDGPPTPGPRQPPPGPGRPPPPGPGRRPPPPGPGHPPPPDNDADDLPDNLSDGPATPAPPGTGHASFEDFNFVGDKPGYRKLRKREDEYRRYSRKVFVKEYRPTEDRLREVLGVDRTDTDYNGDASIGAVSCRKMITQADGGLKEYVPEEEGEIVKVQLKEVPSAKGKRDDDNTYAVDAACYCSWES